MSFADTVYAEQHTAQYDIFDGLELIKILGVCTSCHSVSRLFTAVMMLYS